MSEVKKSENEVLNLDLIEKLQVHLFKRIRACATGEIFLVVSQWEAQGRFL